MKKVMMATVLVGSLSLGACATTGYNDPYYGNRGSCIGNPYPCEGGNAEYYTTGKKIYKA